MQSEHLLEVVVFICGGCCSLFVQTEFMPLPVSLLLHSSRIYKDAGDGWWWWWFVVVFCSYRWEVTFTYPRLFLACVFCSTNTTMYMQESTGSSICRKLFYGQLRFALPMNDFVVGLFHMNKEGLSGLEELLSFESCKGNSGNSAIELHKTRTDKLLWTRLCHLDTTLWWESCRRPFC